VGYPAHHKWAEFEKLVDAVRHGLDFATRIDQAKDPEAKLREIVNEAWT
jgi:hypothetical protein